MKRNILWISLIAIGCFLAVFTTSCKKNRANMVTLAGSTAFQPFAEKLAEKYMESNKDIRINAQGGGSAMGIQSALAGAADIGVADLLELPPEAKALNSLVIARDGIAIVVSKKNPVNGLTSAQARDIFSGKIANWREVGGPDATIRVISREEGSGTRRSFDTLVLKDAKLVYNALYQDSNGTLRETVASDPNAIGYVSIGLVSDKVKALFYNGVAATNGNVKKDLYPLVRPIYFLTKGQVRPQVQAFIDYVLTPESQHTLEEEGLIAIK